MVAIINRQQAHPIKTKHWVEFINRALKAVRPKSDVTIVFVRNAAMRKLNREFRGQDQPTDVLSFPTQAENFETENESHLGEVVISVDRAAAQAKDNGLSFGNEVEQLILHGLLHLCGYDHETDNGEMNRLELKLRQQLEI